MIILICGDVNMTTRMDKSCKYCGAACSGRLCRACLWSDIKYKDEACKRLRG